MCQSRVDAISAGTLLTPNLKQMADRRHGKIISKSVPPLMKGATMENQQVLVGRRVGTVLMFLPSTQMYKVKFHDSQVPYENFFRFEQLFVLVIACRTLLAIPIRRGNAVAHEKLEYIPVKWTQWSAAINNKEVDNNRMIKFEIKQINTVKGTIDMAKIIPVQAKTFSEQDLNDIIDEVWELSIQFGCEPELPEAIPALEDLKAKYV